MLRLKKNQSNLHDLIEYSLLVYGYVVIDDFFSEKDKLFKRLQDNHLKDLSLENIVKNKNYSGGTCKTYIDLLGSEEKNKNCDYSINKQNFEIDLKELVTLPLFIKTANKFFQNNTLKVDVFQTLDTPNSKHGAQDPHFDRIPTLKFMLYVNNLCEDNGAFELSTSSHHWVQRTFPIPRPSFNDPEYLRKSRELPKPSIENLKSIEGKAGTLIIFHTDTIHNQGIVKNGECRIIRSHFRNKEEKLNKLKNIQNLKNYLKSFVS